MPNMHAQYQVGSVDQSNTLGRLFLPKENPTRLGNKGEETECGVEKLHTSRS